MKMTAQSAERMPRKGKKAYSHEVVRPYSVGNGEGGSLPKGGLVDDAGGDGGDDYAAEMTKVEILRG